MNAHTTPIRIFIAYSREDAPYLQQIKKALKPLEFRGNVKIWYDGEIHAGAVWEDNIKQALHDAEIIMLLLSSDAIFSEYFYNKEVQEALARHEQGLCHVVPVVLRTCLWEGIGLDHLQALPQDAKPIADWKTPDDAYTSIAMGIAKLVEEIKTNRRKAQDERQFWEQLKEADALFDQKQYAQALTEYQALLNWGDKTEMGYTDAQPHITQRVFVCKNEVQYTNQKKQAFELHQQGKYADALALTQQLLQHRTDPEVGSLQNELTHLVEAAAAKRRQMLQQGGIAAGALLFLLLAIFGAKQLFFNNDGDNKTAALAGTPPTSGRDNTATTPTSVGSTTSISPTSGGGKGGANDPFANQMVSIQGGTFMMGSPNSEANRDADEYRHQVSVSSFKMSKYEVTQAQWRAIMGSNFSRFSGCNQCPVEQVSWDDIQKFLQKLNALTGKIYRLPTEAEWEYAARGGTTIPFYTGNCLSTDQANYDGNYPYQTCAKGQYREKTTPVGSYAPNKYGLYDMHGNVFEWCNDWYDADYYKNSPTNNPQGPGTGTGRVSRGGSWFSGAERCRVSDRNSYSPAYRNIFNGFRLALPSGI